MAYCRFGIDSNVYLYPHISDVYECCGCWLEGIGNKNSGKSVVMHSLEEVLQHLKAHQDVGHLVPRYAWARVHSETEGRTR